MGFTRPPRPARDTRTIVGTYLPPHLEAPALAGTYATYVDAVTGMPLEGKHVIIKVDQTLDEIADIVVEDI